MRKFFPMLAVAVVFAGASLLVRADEGKKVTLKGMAQCAKCSLGESKSCRNVLVVNEDGKETKYELEMNDVSKKAHREVGFCTAKKGTGPEIEVVGTLHNHDGKQIIVPDSIEKVEPDSTEEAD